MTLGALTVDAPPIPPEDLFVVDTPQEHGLTCVSWNGPTSAEQANSGFVLVREPDGDLDEAVGDQAQQYSAVSVAGADRAIARVSSQPYLDGGGTEVPGQDATVVEVLIQAAGDVYSLRGFFAPDEVGLRDVRSLLSSSSVG